MNCCICGKPISGQYIQGSDGKTYCEQKCWDAQFPKCAECGKPVNGGYTDKETGKHYCSDACWDAHMPKCDICGKPVNGGYKDKKTGKHYCSDACWDAHLPKCVECGKPVKGGYTDTKTGKHYCSDACWNAHLPKCDVCGKTMDGGYTDRETGKHYCSDTCWDAHLPKCVECGKPVKKGFVSDNGEYFCSDACWNEHLPKCENCGKHMEKYITSKSTGKKYCNDECFSIEWPTCHHCGKKMQEWYKAPQGNNTYCSKECLEKEWAYCCICGTPTQNWITDRDGHKFCGDDCYHKHWLVCGTCGEEASKGVTDSKGNFYCSDSCWEKSLPTCPICGKPLVHYIENTSDGVSYCSRECMAVAEVNAVATRSTDYFMAGQLYENGAGGLKKDLPLSIEMYKISASEGYKPAIEKLAELGIPTDNLSADDNNSQASLAQVAGNIKAAKETAKLGEIYSRLSYSLEELKTSRGNDYGFKGFVGERLEAAEASSFGRATYVIDDNHAADLVFVGKNGQKYYQQLKIGYHDRNNPFDFEKYRGQTLLVDKGNPKLARWRKEGKKFGVNVVESNITKQEAESLADWLKWETSLTNSSTATIIPKLASAHRAGMKAGVTGVRFSMGIGLAVNMVQVFKGDKDIGKAYQDIAKDVAITYATSYAQGAVLTAVASTEVGYTVITGAKFAGGAATTYFLKTEAGKMLLKNTMAARTAAIEAANVASNVVGQTAIGKSAVLAGKSAFGTSAFALNAVERFGTVAATQVVGTIGAAGSALGGMAVAATSGTAIGGAVASGVAATSFMGAAIGSAAIAVAPVVASVAAVGAVVTVGKKIWKKIF